MATRAFDVITLDVSQTYDLRRDVLRNGDPDAAVSIPQDDMYEALHVGAVDGEGQVIATASFYPEPCTARPAADNPAQLRFMAVERAWQGSGAGGAVLDAGVQELRGRGCDLLWANARDTALGFYLKHGFEAYGESFLDYTMALPHTVVILELSRD